jgi:flagellar basal body-associated protein FliL
MSDKPAEKHDKPAAEPAADAKTKKKSPVKLFAIVGVLMAAQAGAIVMIMGATSPKVAVAKDVKLDDAHKHDDEATVEISLVDDRFQNMQTGRVWIWDTEIALQVKDKHQKAVEAMLEKRGAEIREGIATIFRKAQHSQLREPGLESLNHVVLNYLNSLAGKDAENEERIKRVLIPKCKGYPAE